MRKWALLLISCKLLIGQGDIHVKNGSGLVTADTVKNFNVGANGSCRDYQSSDTAAVVSSGRICGQFQSTTNFNFASIIFQTAINNTPTYQSNFEIRGDLTMRQHEQEIFDNAKLLEWLDTAGTGITLLDLDNANNVRIGAQLAPTTSGDMYLFVAGNNTAQFRFLAGVYDFSPFTALGAQMGGLHRWNSISSHIFSATGANNSHIDLDARDSGTSTQIFGPVTGANVVLNLPATVPTAGQSLVASAVVGSTATLSWSGSAGCTAIDTEIFFLHSTTCQGDTRLEFDYSGALLRLGVSQVFENALLLEWKDTAGTGITLLDLDNANNVRVGAQLAPTTSGDMYLFNRGTNTIQLVDIAGVKDFSPFAALGAQMGGTHRWNSVASHIFSATGANNSHIDWDARDSATSTQVFGPTTGVNSVWNLPAALPGVGDVLTASAVSGSTITTAWVTPGGASCGGTCMTTNTNQTVTGLKTFSSSIDATSDNTYDLGQGATEWGNVYSTNFVSGIGGTRAGLVAIYNNTSGVYFGFQGSTGSGGNDVLAGPPLGNGSLAPAVAGTTDLGYSGRAWRSLYVNNIVASGVGGLSTTIAVRNSAGSASCTITYTNGIFTSSTC